MNINCMLFSPELFPAVFNNLGDASTSPTLAARALATLISTPSPFSTVENIPSVAAALAQQMLQMSACASLLIHESIPKIPICQLWCRTWAGRVNACRIPDIYTLNQRKFK